MLVCESKQKILLPFYSSQNDCNHENIPQVENYCNFLLTLAILQKKNGSAWKHDLSKK